MGDIDRINARPCPAPPHAEWDSTLRAADLLSPKPIFNAQCFGSFLRRFIGPLAGFERIIDGAAIPVQWRAYPTRLRAVGTGFGSAWLRAGSSIGPILVGTIVADLGIRYVFAAFAAVALVGGLVTLLFAIETRGRVLEELSP